LAGVALSAQAAEFIAPGKNDSNGLVTIAKNETHRNLYIAGGTVTVNGTTQGDLYAAGGTVTIEGDVEDDVVIGGGNVTINGRVGGDIRMGGGNIIINNQVDGDVLVGGGTVRVSDKASIGGDLIAGAGTLDLAGPVSGSAKIAGGVITIASRIGGGVWIRANEQLVFESGAQVGDVSLKGPKEAVVKDGAKVGKIDFEQVMHRDSGRRGFAGIFTLGFVLQLLTFIAAGLVLIWLFPKRVSALAHGIVARPGISLLTGFLTMIAGPILAGLLLITGIGWMLALMVFLVYILVMIMAAVIAPIFVGSWVVQKLTKKPEMKVDWQAVVIGVIIL